MFNLFRRKKAAYSNPKGSYCLGHDSYEALPSDLQGKLTCVATGKLFNAYKAPKSVWEEINGYLEENNHYD